MSASSPILPSSVKHRYRQTQLHDSDNFDSKTGGDARLGRGLQISLQRLVQCKGDAVFVACVALLLILSSQFMIGVGLYFFMLQDVSQAIERGNHSVQERLVSVDENVRALDQWLGRLGSTVERVEDRIDKSQAPRTRVALPAPTFQTQTKHEPGALQQRYNSRVEPGYTFQPQVASFTNINTPVLLHQYMQKRVESPYFLVIGIGTVLRNATRNPSSATYLEQTVEKLKTELDRYYRSNPPHVRKQVLIYVQNHGDGNLPFYKVRDKYQNNINFLFHDAVNFRLRDPFRDIPGYNYKHGSNTKPQHQARQQNCDVLSMTEHALQNLKFEYFMYVEDDMLACEDMFSQVLQVLNLAHEQQAPMCSFRVSYGMNGLVLPQRQLQLFNSYLADNIDTLPIDLLVRDYLFDKKSPDGDRYDFCARHNLISFNYKTVLLEHVGTISSFEERNEKSFHRPTFPKCGHSMSTVWNLSNEERFNRRCANSPVPVSPCNVLQATKSQSSNQ